MIKRYAPFGAFVVLVLAAAFGPSLFALITSLPPASGATRTCRARTGSSAAVGAGIHWTGNMLGSAFESEPATTGGLVDAVVQSTTLTDSVDSNAVQVGLGNVQVLSGSAVAGAVKNSYSGLSASSHLFKVRWATSGGTARVRPATVPNEEHCSIVATEIGG